MPRVDLSLGFRCRLVAGALTCLVDPHGLRRLCCRISWLRFAPRSGPLHAASVSDLDPVTASRAPTYRRRRLVRSDADASHRPVWDVARSGFVMSRVSLASRFSPREEAASSFAAGFWTPAPRRRIQLPGLAGNAETVTARPRSWAAGVARKPGSAARWARSRRVKWPAAAQGLVPMTASPRAICGGGPPTPPTARPVTGCSLRSRNRMGRSVPGELDAAPRPAYSKLTRHTVLSRSLISSSSPTDCTSSGLRQVRNPRINAGGVVRRISHWTPPPAHANSGSCGKWGAVPGLRPCPPPRFRPSTRAVLASSSPSAPRCPPYVVPRVPGLHSV